MQKIFKVLGDKTRLEMLLLIAINPDICLCHIEDSFHLSNSNLSRHLKELEASGLVVANKVMKWKHYQITDVGSDFIKLIKKVDVKGLYNQVGAKSALLDKKPRC